MTKIVDSTKMFFIKCKRVWQVMRRPTKQEYQMVAKISAIGIAALGVIGFLVSLIITSFIK